MVGQFFQKSRLNFRDKVFLLDFKLMLLVLALGIISIFAMYSTEMGTYGYYTKSHIFRFCTFFLLFILISFFRISFWYKTSYFFYLIVLLLLVAVHFYGITSSGSKRWISLIAFNLQPSELMKIALIIFLSRYYNKIPSNNVNQIKFLIIPIFEYLSIVKIKKIIIRQ